jgi:hypothetical protein
MNRFLRCLLCLLTAAAAGRCALADQAAAPPAGPSGLGLAIELTARPDLMPQDGVSQSRVGLVARDAAGQPARGVSFRVDIHVDGKPAEFGTLAARWIATDVTGRGSVLYTAPPLPPPGVETDTTVTLVFTAAGTDYANALARTVKIRLLWPRSITAPAG